MITRSAVRAIIVTPDREVLLMAFADPADGRRFWVAPGGGIEAGETLEAALRRELAEEVGLTDFEIGPAVWRRHHTFNWAGDRISQQEEYRIVHTARFEPVIADALEAASLKSMRWWPLAELAATDEQLTPLSLALILERYFASGAPNPLPETEVLVDWVKPAQT